MRRQGLAALLLLILLLTACAPADTDPEGVLLYFTAPADASYGSALAVQSWQGEGEPDAQMLLEALFAGPTEEGLTDPFPPGVSVLSLSQEESGLLRLTLSEAYSGLTDISRTLADACIVMTVCQLPGVESVEISSTGFWTAAPASRTLSPEQIRLEIRLETLLP